MSLQRRYVLGGLFAIAGVVTAVLLASVLGTVFLAITVVAPASRTRRTRVDTPNRERRASLNRRTRETLSAVAAILQFVPVVGPSVLLAALAGYHLAVGELLRAVLVATVGGVVIALLPDVLIRPRLARRTADIPGSLYFVGFFGGVLTLGPIGVVAGPLAVGLFVEVATLLSAELNPPAVGSRPTIRPIPTLPTPVILTETCNLSMSAPAPR